MWIYGTNVADVFPPLAGGGSRGRGIKRGTKGVGYSAGYNQLPYTHCAESFLYPAPVFLSFVNETKKNCPLPQGGRVGSVRPSSSDEDFHKLHNRVFNR